MTSNKLPWNGSTIHKALFSQVELTHDTSLLFAELEVQSVFMVHTYIQDIQTWQKYCKNTLHTTIRLTWACPNICRLLCTPPCTVQCMWPY